MDSELYPFDSPSPDDLLIYRRKNPPDEASEIRDALAEAELNPWVEERPDTDQIIQMKWLRLFNTKMRAEYAEIILRIREAAPIIAE